MFVVRLTRAELNSMSKSGWIQRLKDGLKSAVSSVALAGSRGSPFSAAAAFAALILPDALYKMYKTLRSEKTAININSVAFNAEDIATRIIRKQINESEDPANVWAKYIIANKLFTTNSDDSKINSNVDLVRKALVVTKEGQYEPEADDFTPDLALKYWNDHGNTSEGVFKSLISGDILASKRLLGNEMYIWMLLLSNEEVFDKLEAGKKVTDDDPVVQEVINKLKAEFEKNASVAVTLQDSKGGRVDFSANPKAVFAPPRNASDAHLGTIDLGVLGDAYICGLSSTNKRRWVLLPSCLQRFAYEQLFNESIARFHAKAKDRSKIDIARVLLF